MTDTNEDLPDSAISSWGGFVYQGKIALYHCLSLLVDKSFRGEEIDDFELQLDSTDDFAIYSNNKVISAHQVKAKLSKYVSQYLEALCKASKVEVDCDSSTVRFFHVAKALNKFDDYFGDNGNVVEFYSYGDLKYCELSKIDLIIKNKISDFLYRYDLPVTDRLIEDKSSFLSELITKKIIYNHSLVHAGESEKSAAYYNRISSSELIKILQSDHSMVEDRDYLSLKLKSEFCRAIDNYFEDYYEMFSNEQRVNIFGSLNFVVNLSLEDIERINLSLQPHLSRFFADYDDVLNYIDLISEISVSPKFIELPHYSKGSSKYLPTSIQVLNERRVSSLKENVIKNIKDNGSLAALLFEYNTLIADSPEGRSLMKITSDKITRINNENSLLEGDEYHIVKEFDLQIISKEEAEGELNAK
ncbi:ABC-three component system protein [Yersinia enterocolitica]